MVDTMLEGAFNRAEEVRSKQVAINVKQVETDSETEQDFFVSILFQRDEVNHASVVA